MTRHLKVNIVTPNGVVYEHAHMVVAKTLDGDLGFYHDTPRLLRH